MDRETVSVIVPAFNAESTIADTLSSVLDQSHPVEEVLVVDDGSTDGTREAVAGFDPRVRCISTPNRGVARARNRGLEEASGRWVAFVDADDRWLPGKVEAQLAALGQAGAPAAATTRAVPVGFDGRPIGEEFGEGLAPADLPRALMESGMVAGPISSLLEPTELAREIGFDPRLSQCADLHHLVRLSLRARVVVVPDLCVEYRREGDRLSDDIGLLERDTMRALSLLFEFDVRLPWRVRRRIRCLQWLLIAGSWFEVGRTGRAVAAGSRAAAQDPVWALRSAGRLVGAIRKRQARARS